MKKKFTAIVLSLSMCLIPISQMQVLNAKTTTQEQKDDISLKFIKGRFGSGDKYEITPKDKLKEITKIFVENNEYVKKDYKTAVFGKTFFVDLSDNCLYLGLNPKDKEVIKIEFKDKSTISFKKDGDNFIKIEENNNKKPSTPNETPDNKDQNDFSLKILNESFFENKYSLELKDKITQIKQIFVNNVEYWKTSSKSAVFGNNYFIDEENKVFYLGQKVPDGHIVKFVFNDESSISFERNGNSFVKKDNNYSKKYYLRIVGSFEAAIIGQQKYDALSSATGGGVNSNKNSNVRLQIAYTDKEIPSDSDFKDAKEVTHNLQLEAKMVSDDSGMQAKYSEMDNSIKLSGIPSKKGNYKVFVQSKDGKLKSNELDFEVFDSNEVTLEERLVDKEFKTLKNPATKKEWDMKPWVIKKFGKDKEEVTVPKNLKLWFGSRESGKYSELGYPIEENKATTQTLIVTGELYLINMKILSSVNIVVKDGGKLNLSDSSLYGKITVENGGTLEVNYDDYHKSFASGSSINGQIILKDGATLQNSVIYSNANYLTDGKNAKHIQTPVVSVQGNATIKGNVFIRGDEAPTGEQYKGQGAMEIAKGKTLTIEKDAKLGLFAGGRYALTSNGGDALKLEGTVAGKGTLIAVGGNGRFSGKGGNGVSGNGTITVDNAYLHGGNSYMSKNEGGKAVLDSITIDKKTKGYAIDGKKSTNSIEDSKLQNETPNWNGYTAPNKDLLDKLSTENAPSIVGEREKKELERILENTKKELEKIKQELEKSKQDSEKTRKELEKIKQELEKAKQELENAKQSGSKKENKIDELSKKIKELEKIEQEFEKAKQESEKTKNELEKAKQELESAKQSGSKKQNEIDELNKKIKELEKIEQEFKKAKEDSEKTKNEFEKTKKELEKTKKEFEKAKQDSEKTKKELEKIKQELEKAKQELESAKQSGSKKQNEIDQLSKKIKELEKIEQEFEKTSQDLEKTKKELEETKQKLEKAKQSGIKKQNEIDDLNKKIKELEEKVNSLKAKLEKGKNNNSSDKQNNNNPKVIEFLYGKNQTVTKNDGHKLYFRLDEDVKNFENVYLDGKLVDPSMYTLKSGSTIVEFANEFKNSLAEGNHNLEFKFKNGYAKTQIHVLNKKEDDKKDKSEVKQTKQKNTKSNKGIPKTNISNSSILLAVTSLVGFLYSKKKK
ncbi:hypothetical protein [uncultured Parvimonas sp.]|uniref:hypothetical protein n=1 Tax=uncultured Parvimonas sp. TaxID=747372 RepID=UPI0028D8A782|nr:hypothetical protein [uncultured Parvimonas sp.]